MITAHVNADGDAISSALAVSSVLRSLGKNCSIILNEPPDEKYRFLAGIDDIRIAGDMNSSKYRNVITLDSPNLSRISMVKEYIMDDAFIINIDHHGDNASFGDINIFYRAASTTEILYRLFKLLDITFTKDLADMIYTGIIYDTGMFRFSITTELSFTIAAEMMNAGARIDRIAENVYFTKDYENIRLLSQVLSGVKLHEDGKVGVMTVARKDIKNICTQKPDLDDFVSYLMMIEGIEVGIFMMEMQSKYYRVSLRSKNEFDVQRIAEAFSGGGHKKAAGCRLKGKHKEVLESLLNEIRTHLPDTA